MIDTSAAFVQSLAVFGMLGLLLAYGAYWVATRVNPTTTAEQTSIAQAVHQSTGHCDIPDDWDEEQPLFWCGDCGTFNHTEYRFCRGCAGELRQAQVVPPRSITQLQNNLQNQH